MCKRNIKSILNNPSIEVRNRTGGSVIRETRSQKLSTLDGTPIPVPKFNRGMSYYRDL